MMILKRPMALILPLAMLASQVSAMQINLNDGAIARHDIPLTPRALPDEVTFARNGACVTDTEGFFGDTNNNGLSLEYYYELDYDTRIVEKVNQSVLKFLQIKISDLLIPILFARTCSNSKRELAGRFLRQLEVIGISALPDDLILTGESCSSDPSETDVACSVGLGKASLFAQPGAVLENEGTRAITAIKAIMNNGALDGSIDGIEHVRFVNGTYTLGLDPAVASAVQGSTSSTDEDGLAGYAIALIVIAVVGVLALAAFLVVERKKMREDKERRKALNNRMVSMRLDELERDTMDIPLD